MSNKTKAYIAVAVVIIVVTLVIAFRSKITALFSPSQPGNPGNGGSGGYGGNGSSAPSLNYALLLKKGSTGNEVKLLQTWLGGLTVDGDFGNNTEARLIAVKGVAEITLGQYAGLPSIITDNSNDEGNPGVFQDNSNSFLGGLLGGNMNNNIIWAP